MLASAQLSYAANVTQMFGHALKVYESGNHRTAAKLLYDIIKKYPGHEPSHLILGRINFRQGQMARAAYHFRKISPDLVDGEAAYEFGITFFSRGQCKLAEAGLKRVGANFRGANLAAFYRGICFSRNREWFRAEVQLEKAVNLPDHLIGVRRRLLSQVRAAQRQTDKSKQLETVQQMNTPQPLVMTPPPPPADYAMSEKDAKAKQTAQPKAPPKKEAPKTGFSASVSPNISVGVKSSNSDFNGTKSSSSDSTTIKLGGGVTLKQVFAPVKNGDQPNANLALNLSYTTADSQGKTSVTKAYEDTPDQPFDVTTNDPKSSTHTLDASAQPEVSYPVLKTVDLIVKGKYEVTNVQEQSNPSGQAYGGSGSIVVASGPISLTALGEYMQFQATIRGSPNNNGYNRLKASASPSYNWPNGFYVEGSGVFTSYGQFIQKPPGGTGIDGYSTTYDGTSLELGGTAGKKFEQAKIKTGAKSTTYTPVSEDRYLSGAQQNITIDGSIEFTLELGATLNLSASNTQLLDYKSQVTKPEGLKTTLVNPFLQDPPPPEKILAKAEGNQQTGSASVNFSPVDGLSINLSASHSKASFTAEIPELTDVLNNQTATTSTSIGFEVSYSKAF